MGILTWAFFGLIAGAIRPGNQGMGWLMTIILGIVGAFVGGAIGVYLLHWGDVSSFWNPRSWILAVGGALLVLWLYGMVTKKA